MSDEHPQNDRGLTTPHAAHNPVINAVEPPKRWTPGRIAIQLAGFAIGLGLLAYTIRLALTGENGDQLARLPQAPPSLVAGLLGFTALSIISNGVMFWAVLRPHRRLSVIDVTATNAIATFLSLLPFKLGLLVRAVIHHRRDGVSFQLLLAWFGAISLLALAIIVPMALAGLWRGRIDALWWIVALGGPVACTAFGVVCGRMAGRWPILSRLSLGADIIVRDISTVATHFVIRIGDVGLLAGRFMVAGMILGQDISLDQAVLIGTTYFLISVISPAGTLGAREAGAAGVGMLQGLDVAAIALLVSAAETIAAFLLGAGGVLKLRLYDPALWRKGSVDSHDHHP